MEFTEVLRRRRMVRKYDPDRPLPADVVDRLVAAALRAPSAGFSQGWGFLVLQSAADRDRFWAVSAGDGEPDAWLADLRTAQLLVVCFSNKGEYLRRYAELDKGWTDRDEARWPVPYWDIDTGFAALLLQLDAVDQGLGTCFFGVPPERIEDVRRAFGVPEDYHPVGVVSVGHPVADRRSPSLKRGHRPISEVVHRGRWAAPVAPGDDRGPE
jgi:nitroreductase